MSTHTWPSMKLDKGMPVRRLFISRTWNDMITSADVISIASVLAHQYGIR